MKLVWHIFLKDLRRLAVPLALWVLLLGLKFAWGWHMIAWNGLNENLFRQMVNVEYLLVWLEVIANFLLVTRLIHEDPLVSEGAFWMTRPISGARLYAAKALGAVMMFGVLPLLLAVPWWLANHYDASLMGEAAWEVILAQAAIALPALVLATLTDGLSRLLLWLLVLAATSVWWFFNALARLDESDGGALTRTCVVLALIAAFIGVVVTLQFLSRRYVRSLVVTGGGVVLIGLVVWFWQWNLVPSWRRDFSGGPDITANNGPSGVTFEIARATVPEFTASVPDYVKPQVDFTFAARGVPAGSMLFDGPITHTWRWSDGTTLVREENSRSSPYSDELDLVARRLLGLPESSTRIDRWVRARGLEPWRGAVLRSRFVKVMPSFANRINREPSSYTATINFLLAQPEKRFEMPAQAGPRQRIGAMSVRTIAQRQLPGTGDQWRVNAIESEPTFVRLALSLSSLAPFQIERDQVHHYVVNRALAEAQGIWGWSGTHVVVGSVKIAWKNFDFTIYPDDTMRTDPEKFFNGAALVGIGFRDYRYFRQELKLERFPVTK